MARRLSRRRKDIVCMQQLAACAYCMRPLCDAFEVDHINERRYDDRDHNLVATCALCHAVKTRHVRLRRDWTAMRTALDQHRYQLRQRWVDGDGWDSLPLWLQQRLTKRDAHLYAASVRAPSLNLEDYRRFPKPCRYRSNG